MRQQKCVFGGIKFLNLYTKVHTCKKQVKKMKKIMKESSWNIIQFQ